MSKDEFYSALITLMDILHMNERDLAHEFGASRPTVARWLSRENMPHIAMRQSIINTLKDMITK